MIKRLSFILALMTVAALSCAQGIAFEPEGTTLEQAAAKAKREHKLLFVDCYTQWCGPCKKMARDVFPQQQVGDFMNPRFVSLKLDMETPYAIPLARQWQVTAYPTFIIFTADAQEVGRFMGGSDADGFIKRVADHSRDDGSDTLEVRWLAGDRTEEFLKTYLASLNATYKKERASEVAEALLTGKEDSFARDAELTRIFMQNLSNPFSTAFIHTVRQPEDLQAVLGSAPVEAKIRSVLTSHARRMLVEREGQTVIDQAQFAAYLSLLRQLGIKDSAHYRLTVQIMAAEKAKDYPAYVNHIQEYLSTPGLDADDMTLARWVKPFSAEGADAASKARIIAILRTRLQDIRSGKRQPQTRMGNMMLSRPTDELLQILITVLETGQVPSSGNS